MTFSNAFSSMKCINEISLEFAPKGAINNIPTLVQIMAWHQPGDKPLCEQMMISLLMHMHHSASMINCLLFFLQVSPCPSLNQMNNCTSGGPYVCAR